MRNLKPLLLLILFINLTSFGQTILFSEDFEGEALGDVSGISSEGVNWTTSCPDCAAGDIFEVDDAYGTLKGLHGNDTNGPATLSATGIDATGMYILILEFDYESIGYVGDGNLECVSECSGCSGNPEDVLLPGCNTCWDFLLWELSTGTFSDGSIILGNNCSVNENDHVISSPGCSSPYDSDGILIPGNDPSNLSLTIAMAMWASDEHMVIDNIVLTGYTKAEGIAAGLINDPGLDNTVNTCPTGSINLFDELLGSPDISGSWDGPSITTGGHLGTLDLSSASDGDYHYIISTGSGCLDTATISLTTGSSVPTAIITGDMDICDGTSITLNGGGTGTYSWGPNGETTNDITISTPGTYTLTVTNSCGSSAPASVTINSLGSTPTASYSGTIALCDGNTTTLTASGGDSYQWSDLSTNAIYSTNIEEDIYVIAYNTCGEDTAFISITDGSVIANFSVNSNLGTEPFDAIFMDGSTNASLYSWDFGNGETSSLQNPNATYPNNGTYTVTLTASNASGCSGIATTTIVVDEILIEIPNVFTPNGDDDNELFRPTSPLIKDVKGSIFDRWGILMTEWTGALNGWDGKHNNKNSSEGTYFYIIDVTLINDETQTFSGSLMLLR